ncbi:unnamed protein product [Arctogadus glacialis]
MGGGVAVLLSPDIPVQLGLESRQQFCLQTLPGMERLPLQYSVCVARHVKAVHQEAASQLSQQSRELPNMRTLWLPFWNFLASVDSGVKVERELRTFSNRLRRHHLSDGVISLSEHSTTLLADMAEFITGTGLQSFPEFTSHVPMTSSPGVLPLSRRGEHNRKDSVTDHDYLTGRKRGLSKRQTRDLGLVKLLNISITLTPFQSIHTAQFHSSLAGGGGGEQYWLSLPSGPQGQLVPVLSQWGGHFCVKLNLTSPAGVGWFLDRVGALQDLVAMEYVLLEGAVAAPPEGPGPLRPLGGERYIGLLADVAARMGESAIMTAGTRTSHKPVFVRMPALQSEWGPLGLRGLIPSLLHHTLLGYNFLLPDAVGGSLSGDMVTDEELFIRWLEVAAFLPVLSFHTPPWVYGEEQVLNLTRSYISLHQDLVVPLIEKYSEEWLLTRHPIYRPMWWLNPNDPATFTIDDQFLIGDEVLVAPVVERGAMQRDIYLPDGGFQWQDSRSAEVFDGGTLLQDYPVALDQVAVFSRRS